MLYGSSWVSQSTPYMVTLSGCLLLSLHSISIHRLTASTSFGWTKLAAMVLCSLRSKELARCCYLLLCTRTVLVWSTSDGCSCSQFRWESTFSFPGNWEWKSLGTPGALETWAWEWIPYAQPQAKKPSLLGLHCGQRELWGIRGFGVGQSNDISYDVRTVDPQIFSPCPLGCITTVWQKSNGHFLRCADCGSSNFQSQSVRVHHHSMAKIKLFYFKLSMFPMYAMLIASASRRSFVELLDLVCGSLWWQPRN